MRKRIQILIGLLWIFAALFFIGKSVPVAREYISFDRQQDEMLHTFIQNEEVMQRKEMNRKPQSRICVLILHLYRG